VWVFSGLFCPIIHLILANYIISFSLAPREVCQRLKVKPDNVPRGRLDLQAITEPTKDHKGRFPKDFSYSETDLCRIPVGPSRYYNTRMHHRKNIPKGYFNQGYILVRYTGNQWNNVVGKNKGHTRTLCRDLS